MAENLVRSSFGPDFIWGVATSAHQIEGSHASDGKGLSIWDVFSEKRGKIRDLGNAKTTCNFFENYSSDIRLLKSLSIPNFRMSISWSRIMPDGIGLVNKAGIDYYHRVFDDLLEAGIEPWVTLYHWDLPEALERKGGWTNRDIVSWFSEYAKTVSREYGNKVKNWMILNEPSVFTGAGYFLGIHAPGKRGIGNYIRAVHHATLATSAAARVVRNNVGGANIGTTFSMTEVQPASHSIKDIAATKRIDTLLNRTFIEPLLGLGYPVDDLPFLRRIEKVMVSGDISNMAFDFDFIGLQCYTREIVKANIFVPYINASLVKAGRRGVPTTDMGWEVYPPSIYNLIKRLDAYPTIKNIIVTENGAAFPDKLIDGKVNDRQRQQYLKEHLENVLRAKCEGAKVNGYFVWTLTDNFEWAEGYHPKFGLVHVDFKTQQRTIKQSGFWYSEFLNTRS